MKYVVLWLAIAAALGLLLLIAIGFGALIQLIADSPALRWIPFVLIAIALIATLAVAIDWYSDHRDPPESL